MVKEFGMSTQEIFHARSVDRCFVLPDGDRRSSQRRHFDAGPCARAVAVADRPRAGRQSRRDAAWLKDRAKPSFSFPAPVQLTTALEVARSQMRYRAV